MPPRGAISHQFDTYVVARDAQMRKGLRSGPGKDILIGLDATVQGGIEGGGSVFLSRGVRVQGAVTAAVDVVVGANANVHGSVQAGGNILVLEGARIHGDVLPRGNARIIGARIDGVLRAGGDVEVRGESHAREIAAGGRVRSLEGPVEGSS